MKALVCHTLTGIEGLTLEQDWPEPALRREPCWSTSKPRR